MADYNPNQFEPSAAELAAQARFPRSNINETDELRREVEELRAEVRKLRGLKTYVIDVTRTVRYTTEAGSESEARDWFEKVGKNIVPDSQGTIITNIKEIA